ncbi:PREDICTED: adropin [Merops nubicus]|uniref:adropin n=1 Tax=Merops nubicus TaxID=57421 RepID=UPI0004F07162|nr:PREDICTED: adropin [Merops nubicus]
MGAALSTGAIVAISFNCVIALLIIILFLILCKACRTPSCPKKSSASAADEHVCLGWGHLAVGTEHSPTLVLEALENSQAMA